MTAPWWTSHNGTTHLELYRGHALDVLRQLPERSVHCVITSPPYWGLRDYKTPPMVWGGRADCPHSWSDEAIEVERGAGNWTQAENGKGLRTGKPQTRFRGDVVAARETIPDRIQRGSCSLCGAWRGTLGLEPSLALYIAHMVDLFREVRRVLRDDGTLWLNMGDCYAGSAPKPHGWANTLNGYTNTKVHSSGHIHRATPELKTKDLVGQPWHLAFALQADGWWLRCDVVWSKPNPMPESITDRPTKAHEYVFLLAKSERYFYDALAISEPVTAATADAYLAALRNPRDDHQYQHDTETRFGKRSANRTWSDPEALARMLAGRNKRSVWEVPTQAYPEAHFATFPEALVEPCILAGTSERGVCAACGAPFARVVERSGGTIGASWHNHDADLVQGQRITDGRATDGTYARRTVGWTPTCACQAPTQPATVLDPFSGSGTTLLVAQRAGRHGIGIELSEEYCQLTRRRLAPVHAQLQLSLAWSPLGDS